MDVAVSCECGATTYAVARQGSLSTCHRCGRQIQLPVHRRDAVDKGRTSGFAVLEEPAAPPLNTAPEERRVEVLVRQINGLISNMMRCVQALDEKLTAEERTQILEKMEWATAQGKAAADAAADGDLRDILRSLEEAAEIIGHAMRRV